jgi:DNA polymerase I-like protein with 3'-5' exonuclease and polymerase domains
MGARAMKVYGGLLTENTVQATARDVLKDARVAAHEAGHNILWDVYDEFIELAPEDEAVERAKALEKIMVSSSPWAKDCPLGVEYEITDRYKK